MKTYTNKELILFLKDVLQGKEVPDEGINQIIGKLLVISTEPLTTTNINSVTVGETTYISMLYT